MINTYIFHINTLVFFKIHFFFNKYRNIKRILESHQKLNSLNVRSFDLIKSFAEIHRFKYLLWSAFLCIFEFQLGLFVN
jgi:hypothetical protein